MDGIPDDIQSRLQLVISKAASLLPSDVGQQLLAMVAPSALATMAGVVIVWAGAHFFGLVKLLT